MPRYHEESPLDYDNPAEPLTPESFRTMRSSSGPKASPPDPKGAITALGWLAGAWLAFVIVNGARGRR